ncbi:MAG TPA: CPBP family intramembrane glutamic endopeptidase [Gammaproteobacteria bacterium]|nr:CPBP family intramembrane glutamic endopeptidase [Gammaproteobacteria bacterium]
MMPDPLVAAPRARSLNAWHALWLVLGYVVAQFLGSVLAGAVWGFGKGFESALEGGRTLTGLKPGLGVLAWSVAAGLALGAAWAVYFGGRYAGGALRSPEPEGVAWRRAAFRAYAVAVLLAVLLMLLAILLEQMYPPDFTRLTGPAEQLARSNGLPYTVFLLCVVFIAPPVEEYIFRGVAFAAVTRSFGVPAAVLLTTLAFALLHYADKIHYWPGFLLVGALGLAAVGLRLRYQSLWPGIALHCCYNGMVLALH